MSIRTIYFAFLLSLVSACNSKENSSYFSSLIPEPDIKERLKYDKAIIDTLFNHKLNNIEVWVKEIGVKNPYQISNQIYPDNVEVTYKILKDSLGKVKIIYEFPYSKSGDWDISYCLYFDKNEKVFAFESQTILNSSCSNSIAYESKTEFYDSDFKIIDRSYILLDENKNILQKDSCYLYKFKYNIASDLNEYLNQNKLKNSR